MTTAREYLQLIITGDARGAVAEMKAVGATARTELGAAEAGTATMGMQMVKTGAVMTAAGAGVIWGLDKLSDKYIETGTEVLKLSRITGGSVQDMSQLKFAAESSAVSVDVLQRSMVLFSRASMSTKGADTLKRLGVSLRDAEGNARPTVDVLKDLSSVVAAMPNGLEKNALAMTLFGRSGASMVPLLNKGGAAIEDLMRKADRLGLTMTDADGAALSKYRQSVRDLNEAKRALQDSLGASVFPAFASSMNAAAGIADGVASSVGRMSPEMRTAAGTAVALAAGMTVAAGATIFFAGATSKASALLRTGEGDLNRYGKALKGVGTVMTVLAASEMVFGFLNDGANRAEKATDAINKMKLAAAGSGDPLKAFGEGVANEQNTLRIQNLWQEFGAEVSIVGTGVKADVEQVQRYFDQLKSDSPNAGTAALDALQKATDGLDHNSRQYKINQEFIDRNRASMKLADDATKAESDALDGLSDAASTSAASLDRSRYSLEAHADAASGAKSDINLYADAMRAAFDPVFGLIDANDRLADAEKRMADAANTNGRDVIDATRSLADAQANLNKVMRDDPLMGLRQVAPEVSLAEARDRLAEANRRLAANPRDAEALTMRDEAVSDMEAANKRAQDLKRQGVQRAEAIESAQRQVSDAQTRLNEVQSQHGLNSEEYRRASNDVLRANFDVEMSTLTLADYINEHGVASIDELKKKMDEWAAKGGPVGAAAERMKASLDPLVAQVLILAAGFDKASEASMKLLEEKGLWGYTLAMLGVTPQTQQSDDKKGNPLFRRAVGNALPQGYTGFRFSAGGIVPGVGNTDSVPAMLTPGEVVFSKADIARAGGMAQIDRIRRGAAAPGRGFGGTVTNDRSVTFQTRVTQVVRDDQAAGAALLGALRDVAWRSGKGLLSGDLLNGVR